MEVDWNALVGEAVSQLIKIFVPVLIVLVLKWIIEIYKKLKESNPQLAKLLAYAAETGYAAAEDYFRKFKTVNGEDKMVYAISRAKEYLDNVGVSIPDEDVIKDAITQYGVSNYKFSWTKPMFPLSDLVIKEVRNDGQCAADHLCVRDHHDDPDSDHHAGSQQPAGPDQEAAENKDGK